MDFNKYKGTGAGLDSVALMQLYNILESKESKENINILEFGSGQSTKFLRDYAIKTKKKIFIDSYDNDPNYCYKNNKKDDFINLKIKPLITCSETFYNKQIKKKNLIENILF